MCLFACVLTHLTVAVASAGLLGRTLLVRVLIVLTVRHCEMQYSVPMVLGIWDGPDGEG